MHPPITIYEDVMLLQGSAAHQDEAVDWATDVFVIIVVDVQGQGPAAGEREAVVAGWTGQGPAAGERDAVVATLIIIVAEAAGCTSAWVAAEWADAAGQPTGTAAEATGWTAALVAAGVLGSLE